MINKLRYFYSIFYFTSYRRKIKRFIFLKKVVDKYIKQVYNDFKFNNTNVEKISRLVRS